MKRVGTCLLIVSLLYLLIPMDDVQAYGWGYKRSDKGNIPEIGVYEQLIKPYDAFYIGDSDKKEIYLTFDNGYEAGYTASFLDVLKKHDVQATFFVTGHYVKEESTLLNRMAEEGHIIGNHSYSHPDFTRMSKNEMEKELTRLDEAVKKVANVETAPYLRPPRGTFDAQTLKWAEELGYAHIFWSVAFKDWETDKQKGWQYSYESVMDQVHPGAIILLHTVSEDNARALDKIITKLKEDGYTFKNLDYLYMTEKINEPLLF
ncbi:MAG TPA: delta-lactam-biosynthetic de-N-acetylase [Pseudogracilibacillus sp.]|nr:delta-lactam-biosynthetic de-N-acetylase [Pseudogracilibacillus sp.]